MKHFRLSLLFLFLCTLLFQLGCNNSNDSSSGHHSKNKDLLRDSTNTSLSSTKSDFNIYIENSASMDGYVKEPTDFKNGLYKLIGDIQNKGLSDKLRLNFINDTICPQKPDAPALDIIYFIQNLKPTDFKSSGCGVKTSFLPNIVNKAIAAYPKDVNILISDCIFSSEKGNSTNYLSAAQQSMRTFIKTELNKNDISTIVIKMKSQFFGTYFIENKSAGNKTKELNGQKRPYYIIIFGNPQSIKSLLEKIDFSEYTGFEKSYYLLTPNANKPVSKVIRKDKIGDFEIEQPASKLVINNAKADNEKSFQFSVASNLKFLEIDDSYLTNIANYEVSQNYKLISVSRNNDPTDESLTGFTHVFTIQTSDLKPNQDVFIKLKSNLPPWVDASSTEDDSNPEDSIQQGKTFGFKYLIEGISDAYADKYQGKEQFGINIKVSSSNYDTHGSSAKFYWGILFLLVFIIGILVYLKNKNN